MSLFYLSLASDFLLLDFSSRKRGKLLEEEGIGMMDEKWWKKGLANASVSALLLDASATLARVLF